MMVHLMGRRVGWAGVLLCAAAASAPAWSSAESSAEGGCIFGSGPLAHFNLPLETQRIDCPSSKAVVLVEAYGDFWRTPYLPYHYPKGWLLRLPVLSVRAMPSEGVEVQVTAPAMLYAHADDGARRNEGGDIVLGTKWTPFREGEFFPGVAARWAVKLPNASSNTGLGTDQTDVITALVLSKTLAARVQVDANVGLSIEGDPRRVYHQVDIMTYGVAASFPVVKRLAGVFEIEGSSGKRAVDPSGSVRLGAVGEGPWESTMFYAAFSKGLVKHSPEWGLRLGMGWAFEYSSRRAAKGS